MKIAQITNQESGVFMVRIDDLEFHFSGGPEATAFMMGALACTSLAGPKSSPFVDINILRPLLEEIAEGREMHAAMEIRGLTGLPLKDAKDALDGVFSRLDTTTATKGTG